MAREAVLVLEQELPINFTVADGTAIEKGALLKLTDNMTAAQADGTEDILAGIAASEKIANDGRTKLGVYRKGIFRMYLSGASLATGNFATSAALPTNAVLATGVTTHISGGKILGHLLEDGTAAATSLVAVNII